MHNAFFMRIIALGTFATLCLGAARVDAASLNTADFVAACSGNASIAEDPGFEDGKVTAKGFCECIGGELEKNKLTQQDVDMLTKLHNEEINDDDVESFPTLDDLLNANEGYEDTCRKSLGLPTDSSTDIEEEPSDEGAMPEEEEAPAEDDGSPPE